MSGTELSQLIQADFIPKNEDFTFIDYSNMKITKIGNIQPQYTSKIKIMNLSSNNIKRLQGIQQFVHLQNLNLSNNKISDGNEILKLLNLKQLKKIFLSNNPFLTKPLQQQVLTYLGGLNNDLSILQYIFCDQKRQLVVNENKIKKSISKSPYQSRINQISSSRQKLMNKSLSKKKLKILMQNMQEQIQQKQQSQQISSEEIQKNQNPFVSFQRPKSKTNSHKEQIQKTPSKITPKFNVNDFANSKNKSPRSTLSKFQIQSTKIKQKNIDVSFQTNQVQKSNKKSSNKIMPEYDSSIKYDSQMAKQIKYQVDNLRINMQTDVNQLNYPSIIEKQDNDSYQIQFDFMSPQKIKKSSESSPYKSKGSPYQMLKINEMQQDIIEQYQKQSKVSSIRQIPAKLTPKKQSVPLTTRERKISQISQQSLHSHRPFFKGNKIQNQNSFKGQKLQDISNISKNQHPIKNEQYNDNFNVPKNGSLYDSVRSYVPQNNVSNTLQLINRVFSLTIGDLHLESQSQSPLQIIQNIQKFQKFYYSSLARIKPTFNLLYSPFSSLNIQQKNILLQELFKNHKQIFMLLLKQFYSRKQSENNFKLYQKQYENLQMHYESTRSQLQQIQLIKQVQKQTILQMQNQNNELRQQLYRNQRALSSRQKIISDVEKEYQKIQKFYEKKQKQLIKYQNQDDLEEIILNKRQQRIKKEFIKKIISKGQKTFKIKYFQEIRRLKEKKRQQLYLSSLKSQIFFQLKILYQNKLKVNKFINKTNKKILKTYLNEFKNQVQISKISKKLQKSINFQKKKDFFNNLINKSLKNKRKRKLNQIYRIKTLKKIFIKGFKTFHTQSKKRNDTNQTKINSFEKKRLLIKYFKSLKGSMSYFEKENQLKIPIISKKVILKRQFYVFAKIIKFQKKEELDKIKLLKQNIFRQLKKKNFIQKLQKNSKKSNLSYQRNEKVKKHILKRYFSLIKVQTFKQLKKYKKQKEILKQLAQKQRMSGLISQFKQNLCQKQMNKVFTRKFFDLVKRQKMKKDEQQRKSNELKKYLNFRRQFKGKHNFIAFLRQLNFIKVAENELNSLDRHRKNLQLSYKQTYDLNIQTIQGLKEQINNYISQIQFSKLQINKLSQRELLILQQKQGCLLEIQSKSEQNIELRRRLAQYERSLQELQKKYVKSLDMYTAALQDLSKQQTKLQSSFLMYDSLSKMREKSPNRYQQQTTQFYNFTSIRK